MSAKRKKFYQRLALPLVFVALGISFFGNRAFSQSIDCTNLPSVEFTQNTQATDTYAIWVLARTETPTATPYVSVDGKDCERVALPAGDGWEWVSGSRGVIKKDLKAGDHKYSFSVTGGAILADKILATNDLECVPVGDGKNCFDQTLSFEIVGGIQQGVTVTGEHKVQAVITNSIETTNDIEFLLDGKSVARQNTSPFCLADGATEDSCGLFNFSTLSEGEHTLQVIGYQEGEIATQKQVSFKVGRANGPTLSLATVREYDEANADKPDNIQLTVDGIDKGQIVSGEITVSASVSGNTSPARVYFAINSIDMAMQEEAPYCLRLLNDGCGTWDSRSLVNGKYTLQVAVVAEGSKNKYASIDFTIDNLPSLYSVGTKRQEVIVGNPNQQMSGKVKVTLPDTQMEGSQLGKKIDYSMDGELVATAYDSEPSVLIDSGDFSNGTHVLSARITNLRGESIVLQSSVTVKNDILTSVIMWLQDNVVVLAIGGLMLGAMIFVPLFMVARSKRNRQFNFEHNINQDYQYTESYSVYSMKNHTTQSLVAFVVVLVGVIGFIGTGSSSTGVKTGFAMELDDASTAENYDGIKMMLDMDAMEHTPEMSMMDHSSMGDDEQINGTSHFMRLNFDQTISENTAEAVVFPEAVPMSQNNSNVSGLTSNVAVTTLNAIEGEMMNLPLYVGRVSADGRASGGLTMQLSSASIAFRSQKVNDLTKVIIRARGNNCEGDAKMTLRVNNSAVGSVDVGSDGYQEYSFNVSLVAGSHGFGVSFDNDYRGATCDRDLFIDRVLFVGPGSNPVTPSNPNNPTPPTNPGTTPPTNPTTPTPTNPGTTPPTNPTTPTPTNPTTPPSTGTRVSSFEGESMTLTPSSGYVANDVNASGDKTLYVWGLSGGMNAGGSVTVNSAAANSVVIRARADVCQGGPIMKLSIDDDEIGTAEVTERNYALYEYEIPVDAGTKKISVTFSNDLFQSESCDRNLYIDSVYFVSSENPVPEFPEPVTPPTNPTPPTTPPTNPGTTPTNPGTTPTNPGTPTTPPTGPVAPSLPTNPTGPTINPALIPARAPGLSYDAIIQANVTPQFADIGAFRTNCTASHFSADDPIVVPGQPGGSHFHTFFGNTGVDAFTTYDSLKNSGNSTCSGGTLNRSGYWVPTIIDTKTGAPVIPEYVLVYYKTAYNPGISRNIANIKAPPTDLRMIAGTSSATSFQAPAPDGGLIVNFSCNRNSGFHDPASTVNPTINDATCPSGFDWLFQEIRFPQCWDGVNLESANHKSHMAYPNSDNCPASHPVAIPEIRIRAKYNYYDDHTWWRLSSDNYQGGGGGYSSHADWWNGWDENLLERIRQQCWSIQHDCMVNWLGNGEMLALPPRYP